MKKDQELIVIIKAYDLILFPLHTLRPNGPVEPSETLGLERPNPYAP